MLAQQTLAVADDDYPNESSHSSGHDIAGEAAEIKNIALTPFPSLTGLRPSAVSKTTIVESLKSGLSLPDLQSAARRDRVLLAEAVQKCWARLVGTYTGSKDDVVFLTKLPAIDFPSRSQAGVLRLCRYTLQGGGQAVNGNLSRHYTENDANNTTENSSIQNESETKGNDQREGTLLDLKELYESVGKENSAKDGGHHLFKHITTVEIRIRSSPDTKLSLVASATDGSLNEEAAKLLLAQFNRLLKNFVSNSEQDIDSQVLSISNSPPAKPSSFSSLQHQFEAFAKADIHRIALEFWYNLLPGSQESSTKWTYGELNQKAEAVAADLQTRFGSLTDCIVPICMDRCPEIYAAILGVLKAGHAWCPIDPIFPPHRRHDLIARVSAKAIIINRDSPQDGIPDDVIIIDVAYSLSSDHRQTIPSSIRPETTAYFIWTSGTTGAPKGVPIHHGAAVESMRALQSAIPTDVENGIVRCLQFSQFTFDVFVQDLFYTWGVGGTLISTNRATMLASFADLATRSRATHAHLTPAFGASVPRKMCPTLEVVTMIGEKLTQSVADDWSDGCRLYNTYGPAENTVVSTLRLVPHCDTMLSVNVGYPLPTVSAFVVHNGKPVMKNGIGELALGGPQVSKGYWHDPSKTKERFMWNERLNTTLYMTGDIVRQLYDGSLEFVGRNDDLVKIQGIRIELSEIAFALRTCHIKVQQIEIMFLERPDRPSKVIVAFLAGPDLETPDGGLINDEKGVEIARSALDEAKKQLPDYMIPKIFLVVGVIPRTSAAKVDRGALKRIYADVDLGAWERKLGQQRESVHREDEMGPYHIKIVTTIAELTGTATAAMGFESTLPSIGVDSITATRLATKLHVTGIDISVASILQCQTLGDLLDHRREEQTTDKNKVFDVSAFHQKLINCLPPELAQCVELAMPVLPLQESLLSESFQNSSSYWSNSFFSLGAKLDLQRLEQSWTHVTQHTEALRTVFCPVAALQKRPVTDTTFIQLILKETKIDWMVTETSEPELETKARNRAWHIADKHQRRCFADPPWAVTIFLQDSGHFMMISIHHSIRDEPSLDYILADVEHVYLKVATQSSGQRHQLRDAISLLYVDSDRVEEDEKVWTESLSDFIDTENAKHWPELKLRSQKSSESTITYTWHAQETYKTLQARAMSIGAASVASLLRVVWGCILLEYLETDRVVFGETWSSRSEASALADVVGPLISVIPVPFKLQGSTSETLRWQPAFQNRSRRHDGIHPRVLRKIMNRPRNEALYPAIFNFILVHAERSRGEDLGLWQKMDSLIELNVEHTIAFNASLSNGGSLDLELAASNHHMDEPHLRILAEQIDAFVDIILHIPNYEPSRLTSHLPRQMLSMSPTNSETSANSAWTQSPTEWVDKNASFHPNWPAVEVVSSFVQDEMVSERWSYEQLHRAYQSISALIINAGCTKQAIAVCLDRRLDVYAIILAILRTGNVYLPIAEDLPDERKRFLIQDSEAGMLFTTRSLAEPSGRADTCDTIYVDDIDYSKLTPSRIDIPVAAEDNAYLLYTSGSTGTPKGVLVSRGNLNSFIEAISLFIGTYICMPALGGKGKWLGMASYAFDVHLLEMFFCWRHGMAAITAPKTLLLDNLSLALRKLKVTHASFVPSLVDNAGLDPASLPDLRYMSVGGEKITKKCISTWAASHVVLANAYGPTEMTIGCCFKRVEPDTNARNIGSPLPYTIAHVLRPGTIDYALRGTSGELCLTGDLVATGYHKRPDAKGFVEDFGGKRMYRTGDRVRLMADGSLEFLGRDDDQTKIRGQRIELGEVSEAVRSATAKILNVGMVEVAAIVVQHPSLARPQLVALLATQDQVPMSSNDASEVIGFESVRTTGKIRDECISTLPSYMVPDHIVRLASLPLVSISRKVDNKRLQALFTQMSLSELTSHQKPVSSGQTALTEAEKIVRDLAAEVLTNDQKRIAIDTNLFRLGLDSLNVIGLTIKLQKMGFESTVSSILKNPTIEQIARLRRDGYTNGVCQPASNKCVDLASRFRAHESNGHDRSDVSAVRPCLPLQETLVASSMSHEGQALYVNHVVLELAVDVDLERLIHAWRKTAENHEILRTYFQDFEKHFVQVILKDSNLSCDQLDIAFGEDESSCLRRQQPNIATKIISDIEFKTPIRLSLASSTSSGHRRLLMISLHHALYDAQSFSMILDEVYLRYQGIVPPEHYTPIAALLNHIDSQDPQKAKAFWMTHLAAYKSTLFSLPSAEDISFSATKELATPLTRIESLAALLNTTPASLFQSLFGIVLAETHGTDDIVFGTILSGRTVPIENINTILAPCITTIPQRVQLRHASRLNDIIADAQKGFVESIEYQFTALRDIHRWVAAERPLFDTLFSYTRKRGTTAWKGLWTEMESNLPNEFPLAVEIVADSTNDHVILRCDFSSAFCGIEGAEAFLNRLEVLVDGLMKGEAVELNRPIGTQKRVAMSSALGEGEWIKEENLMRDIAADIVGIERNEITRNASFFALGVDSIMAIPFAKRLRQQGIQCSSADVMRYSSISELIRYIFSKADKPLVTNGSIDQISSPERPDQAGDDDLVMTYPCTPLQASMLTQTLGSDGSLYVHHHAVRIVSGIDPAMLKKAWEDLVTGTEILRTSFHFSAAHRSWLASVRKTVDIAWTEHDPSKSVEQVMTQINQHCVFRKEGDFARLPWALNVVGDVHILSLHHSLYDGESLTHLFHDLMTLYGGDKMTPRPPFSQAAHTVHQRGAEAEEYWTKSLKGFKGTLVTPSNGAFHEIRVPLKTIVVNALAACKRLDVTLQSVALLAYAKSLALMSSRRDVVFGHVVRGRSLPTLDADEVTGPLFNTVPMRVDLRNQPTTNREIVTSIQRRNGELQAYQHASLSQVQQLWREDVGNPDAKLIDALFVFRKRGAGDENGLWTTVNVEGDGAPTEYATNLEFEQGDNEFAVCVISKVIQDLDAFVRVFERIMGDVLERPDNSATTVLDALPAFTSEVTPEGMERAQDHPDSAVVESTLIAVRRVLAKVSGIPEANIVEDASIFSLGLDSISAIHIAATGRKEGLIVTVADILQGRTLRGICQRVQRAEREGVAKRSQTNDASAQSSQMVDLLPHASSTGTADISELASVPKDHVEDVLPCLPGQVYHLNIWLKSGRTIGEATFTYISGESLDAEKLLDAWRSLRGRHAILRTLFVAATETGVRQIILRPAAMREDNFQILELPKTGEDEIARVVKQEASRRFDLFSPPAELVLIRTGEVDYLTLRLHHALYDAWTITTLVQDLCTLYEGRPLPPIPNSSTILRNILHSSTIKSSQPYWRKSLQGAHPTILRSNPQLSGPANKRFLFTKTTLLHLHHLERTCQSNDISLPTLILIAFARVLAQHTSISSPVFGLYQTARSGLSDGAEQACIPCLNVTPLLARDVLTRGVGESVEKVQLDLAERVGLGCEQSYLRDVMTWIGYGAEEGEALFNTFVNIIWNTDVNLKSDAEGGEGWKLLQRWKGADVEDLAPACPVPGRTAVDSLDTAWLAGEKMFLDVVRDGVGDRVELVARCDGGVMGEEEARWFVEVVGREVERCVWCL